MIGVACAIALLVFLIAYREAIGIFIVICMVVLVSWWMIRQHPHALIFIPVVVAAGAAQAFLEFKYPVEK